MSFLSKDGYINTPAFIELVRDIDKLAAAEGLKPMELWFSKKAIVRDDHPSAAKIDAAAFEKKRAQPIKMRKRAAPSGSAVRMMVLLRNYKGLDQFADYWKDYQLALKAIERHNTKADRAITSLKTAAAKKRDKLNAAFDKNIDCLTSLVEDLDGIEVAIGMSMMGKTLLLKLPNGGVVSVGKSDLEKFEKAQESQEEAAPAKKAVGTRTGRTSASKAAPASKPATRTAASKAATAAKPATRKAPTKAATVEKTVKKALKPVPAVKKTTRR